MKKELKCSECNKVFKTSRGLLLHEQGHGNEGQRAIAGEKVTGEQGTHFMPPPEDPPRRKRGRPRVQPAIQGADLLTGLELLRVRRDAVEACIDELENLHRRLYPEAYR